MPSIPTIGWSRLGRVYRTYATPTAEFRSLAAPGGVSTSKAAAASSLAALLTALAASRDLVGIGADGTPPAGSPLERWSIALVPETDGTWSATVGNFTVTASRVLFGEYSTFAAALSAAGRILLSEEGPPILSEDDGFFLTEQNP